jgi:hypothetical protein
MSASEITILVAGVVAGEHKKRSWVEVCRRQLLACSVVRREEPSPGRRATQGTKCSNQGRCFSKRWPSKAGQCVESGAMAQIVSATVIIDAARRLAGLVSRLGACGLWRVGNRCWRRPKCRLVPGAGATRRIARAQAGSKK